MFNSTLYTSLTLVVERCIVRSGVPRAFYSVGKYKEDAVCIERNFKKGETIVYDGINGKKENVSTYSSAVYAVSEFIDRVYSKMEEESEKYTEVLAQMCNQEQEDIARTIEYAKDKLSNGDKIEIVGYMESEDY